MKIREVHFLKSCSAVSQFPRYRHPEIAFFGRSNVGKSSLINMIMKKQRLVKTGSMPGVTKTVNFFLLNDSISHAVFPVYSYAKLPHAMRKAFLPLIKKYIEGRGNLRLAFLLIDVRRVPDDAELEILSLLTGRGVPVAVTLTKCDKLSRNQRARSVAAIADALGVPRDAIFMSSAKSEEGRKELLGLIEEHASAGTGD
ncbi:MAG TPA: ribosome biogenesis GTP-binding protein YihA/YsxC [Spirochaetota bacterium]|nr:ribosome biogenesis GTP-binding protein YihA/YsxC [Spirochaetota bacterium]